ncbi:MAG: SUMF1/EgtB/PvdO family nonheme iron enzyme [Cyanobacteria bacterium J06638_22]
MLVDLEQTSVADLQGQDLQATFQKQPAVLLITGEGGAGKTSLAYQIARWGLETELSSHRMLPVLIENELDEQTTLLEAIRGQLGALTSQPEPISPELLEKLLQRQRVLVIVDHLSEMNAATRNQIKPLLPNFPARALIVTSRLEESLGGVPKTILQPRQIEANRLWPFMSAYLEAKGKAKLFIDDDYSYACDRLRQMAGERPITVLLARFFIDFLVQEKEGSGGIIPNSIPKLMLRYLNQLNQNIDPEAKRDDLDVHRDASIVAWECLRKTYRPQTIRKQDAIAALAHADSDTAKARLEYLENRLSFLITSDSGNEIRIILDPLAEYMAAVYLVEQKCQHYNPEAAWDEFFEEIDTTLEADETPEIIRGSLLAVRDCCMDHRNREGIPTDLPDRLARKVNIDPEKLRQEQENRRIRRLISELSAPELKYRLSAAEDLGNWGTAARMAQPNLIGMLENPSQESVARQAAATALGKLGVGQESLLTVLTNSHEDLAVRRAVAEALGRMGQGTAELLEILNDKEQPLPLRQGTSRALSLIGAPSGEAVPMLMVKLHGEAESTEVKSISVWREPLTPETPDLTLDLVAIPAGEFLMGSPLEEEGRDDYRYNFPEIEGLDVEQHHRVAVPGFFMSQFPITQAQWRAVAALPKVNRELDPDPANFKGGNRPVEVVDWYEAVEFCDRLSQHTGKTYRLPSEAEWEYACRAGTTTPFHFGDTLSAELANYNATDTYANGATGIYRQKTTEVGSFGLVNAFGLADMHGNVYEWCLDHWHPTYDNAPTDGSAWTTDGDDRYRLVRGGSWYDNPAFCRSAYRDRNTPLSRNLYIGFRVVCVSSWTL